MPLACRRQPLATSRPSSLRPASSAAERSRKKTWTRFFNEIASLQHVSAIWTYSPARCPSIVTTVRNRPSILLILKMANHLLSGYLCTLLSNFTHGTNVATDACVWRRYASCVCSAVRDRKCRASALADGSCRNSARCSTSRRSMEAFHS